MFELDVRQTGYKEAQLTSFYDRLLERINGLPGVQSSAFSRVANSRGVWGAAILVPGDRKTHVIRGNFIHIPLLRNTRCSSARRPRVWSAG
jgi:hypothetical protein